MIPTGNHSRWVFPPFPRLAGGLLPYAPTYSSWLDCWSQLHREVSAEADLCWDTPGHKDMERSRVGAPCGLERPPWISCGPSMVVFPFQGNMSRGNSLFFRKVPAGKRYVWEERRFR